MNVHILTAGPARPVPARNPRRPRSVRPRFKQATTARPEPVLPPTIELQADQHPYFRPFDAAGAAARDGHPLAFLIRLRQEAANKVEWLLSFLDATEGDPDAEADEPTMAAIRAAAERYRDEQEDDEDGADDEPSLGMSEPILTGAERDYWFPYYSDDAAQARPLATACTDDREDDGDDLEPSLCGVTAGAVPLIGGAVEDGEINDDDHDTDLGWTRTGAWGNTLDLEEALS